ncbi:YxeA family protein [Lacticaseibacillus baoqingensis]|uniref:YxeA family protein n=1 Tax=Lacticaseibacillus baoqingensis TaxID=2486013 RepID=A0ABW4E6B6_9LACO|nr:YxeA family protein [Lacticaseibacillus baoqingensis]
MKKWQKRLLTIGLSIGLALGISPWLTRNQTTAAAAALDYANPVVPVTTVYVDPAVPEVQWHANNHGGLDYTYAVMSYDATGSGRKLMLHVSDAPLPTGTPLAVKIKGQTVLSWESVSANKTPKLARQRLSLKP